MAAPKGKKCLESESYGLALAMAGSSLQGPAGRVTIGTGRFVLSHSSGPSVYEADSANRNLGRKSEAAYRVSHVESSYSLQGHPFSLQYAFKLFTTCLQDEAQTPK